MNLKKVLNYIWKDGHIVKNNTKHCPDKTCCEGFPKSKKKTKFCSCKKVNYIDVSENGWSEELRDTCFLHWGCMKVLTLKATKELGLR